MPRKVFMETFGCQMNVLDSQLVLSQLRNQGYEPTEQPDQADVILYNTCSVREHAEQKVWSRLGELRPVKAANPQLVIGVIGCMAEREGSGLFQKYPHIDVLCGPAELDKLPAMVHNAVLNRAQTQPDLFGPKRQVALMGSRSRRSSTLGAAQDSLELLDLSRSVSPGDDIAQAYVRITRGCNKFCAYCVVPHTRGPEVHRPPGNIIQEVRKLVDGGALEVTLLGQTVNHYAYQHGDGRTTTFAELLYQIHQANPTLPRLRFVTSFPRDFTDAALQAMRDCPRICRYLHVPAQSGSDTVLKRMNRGYTAQQYTDFIDRARQMMPDISIASDFIVGYCGETDADHQASLDLIRHCRFKNSFIFKYSPRPGTAAIDRFPDDVPDQVKRQRNNQMLAIQQEIAAELNRQLIGKTVQVMVEGESRLTRTQAKSAAGAVELGWEKPQPPATGAKTQLVARTGGDQIVCFDADLSLKGRLVDVTIVDAQAMTLFGKLAHLSSVPECSAS